MNFDFPDDMKMLRDEAQKFLATHCPRSSPRKILEGAEPYDRALWNEMSALGWIGASVPEAYGGVGLGSLGVCVLAEELGRVNAPVPYASSVYGGIEALLTGGSDEILRNIIAERVLKLPVDVRVGKDVPFTEVPTGKRG